MGDPRRADMKIHITNPNALAFFVAGYEYVCTFTKVEKSLVDQLRNDGVVFIKTDDRKRD